MLPGLIMRFSFAAALVSLILISTAPAQSYRSKVSGIVTDQSGAVVVGATVTLLNVNTGTKTVRKSSETGLFLFDLIDPGSYSVTIEAAGFTRFIQENIQVQTR